VVYNCILKNIDVEIVARKIWKETRYKQNAVSYVNGNPCAWGLMQINMTYWDYKVYYHDNKRYAQRIHNDADFIYTAICYIGVNVDIGTDILSFYLEMYTNNYAYALTAYWAGQNSRQMRELGAGTRNHYIDDILNKQHYEIIMQRYNGWEYVRKKL